MNTYKKALFNILVIIVFLITSFMPIPLVRAEMAPAGVTLSDSNSQREVSVDVAEEKTDEISEETASDGNEGLANSLDPGDDSPLAPASIDNEVSEAAPNDQNNFSSENIDQAETEGPPSNTPDIDISPSPNPNFKEDSIDSVDQADNQTGDNQSEDEQTIDDQSENLNQEQNEDQNLDDQDQSEENQNEAFDEESLEYTNDEIIDEDVSEDEQFSEDVQVVLSSRSTTDANDIEMSGNTTRELNRYTPSIDPFDLTKANGDDPDTTIRFTRARVTVSNTTQRYAKPWRPIPDGDTTMVDIYSEKVTSIYITLMPAPPPDNPVSSNKLVVKIVYHEKTAIPLPEHIVTSVTPYGTAFRNQVTSAVGSEFPRNNLPFIGINREAENFSVTGARLKITASDNALTLKGGNAVIPYRVLFFAGGGLPNLVPPVSSQNARSAFTGTVLCAASGRPNPYTGTLTYPRPPISYNPFC